MQEGMGGTGGWSYERRSYYGWEEGHWGWIGRIDTGRGMAL